MASIFERSNKDLFVVFRLAKLELCTRLLSFCKVLFIDSLSRLETDCDALAFYATSTLRPSLIMPRLSVAAGVAYLATPVVGAAETGLFPSEAATGMSKSIAAADFFPSAGSSVFGPGPRGSSFS